MESEDAEAIKAATDALTTASHKLAELMYAQASQQGAPGAGAGAAGGKKDKGDDDVVDADFEEVK